jgi:phospholipid-translocating ATPase
VITDECVLWVVRVQDRDKESIYVRVLGMEERWELLNILEFNSDRKRMSVILRDPTTGTPLTSHFRGVGHLSNHSPASGLVRLFCKGADNVIFGTPLLKLGRSSDWVTNESPLNADRLAPGQDELKNTTFDHLATFGSEGLRTLVFASRVIPSEEYDAWNERYRQAALKIYGREEAVRLASHLLTCA